MVMVILMSILIEEWRQKMKWTEFDMNSNLIVIIRTVSIYWHNHVGEFKQFYYIQVLSIDS